MLCFFVVVSVFFVFVGFFLLLFFSVVLFAFFVLLFFFVFCVVGCVVFCGGVLCNCRSRIVERLVVVLAGVSVCFETVVFVNCVVG